MMRPFILAATELLGCATTPTLADRDRDRVFAPAP